MNEEATQEWLYRNTLWCDVLACRMTPGQCQVNRERARSEEYRSYLRQTCLLCPGLDPADLPAPASDPERATRRCAICKQKKPPSRFRRSKTTGNLLKRCMDCE